MKLNGKETMSYLKDFGLQVNILQWQVSQSCLPTHKIDALFFKNEVLTSKLESFDSEFKRLANI